MELDHGPAGNICDPKNLKALLHDIRLGRVRGVMLQPPCDSMSAIRNIDRRGPLRSRSHPWGAAWVQHDAKLLAKVETGNKCARATAKIAKCCLRHGVPFVCENPGASWLWKLPVFQDILSSPHAHMACADQCMYGARWRKRTGLLLGHVSEECSQKLERRCLGKRSICDRTGRAHILLIGTDSSGVSWTKRAQSYPLALAQAIANVLIEPTRSELLCRRSALFAGT